MGYGNDFEVRGDAVDQRVGVASGKDVAPATVPAYRPALWSGGDGRNSGRKRQEKATSRQWAPRCIPIPGCLGILDGFRVPARLTRNHGRGVP